MNPKFILDLLKHGADVISNSDYIEMLGVAKELNGVAKVVLSVPDILLRRKLNALLTAINLSEDERIAYLEKNSKNAEGQRKIGWALLELVNRADSTTKAEHIASLFSDYIRTGYDLELFLRYSQIINSMYADELQYFLSTEESKIDETSDLVEHLISIGVYTRTYGSIGFGNSISPQKKPTYTEAGEKIFNTLNRIKHIF